MALLVGALGLFSDWSFEVAEAKSRVSEEMKRALEPLADRLSSEWRAFLVKVDLWNDPSGRWTRQLIQRRANVRLDVCFSVGEMELAQLALKVMITEFQENWDEFCVVATGALDWYPVGPEDLERLADRLEGEPR